MTSYKSGHIIRLYAKHPDLVRGGMNLTQAAHAAGVSKCTGKAWRNGRTRSTGRNERPLADRCLRSLG